MAVCYIGLGSNLDGPERQVRSALVELAELPETRLLKTSSLYRSRPLGGKAQPDYINAVAQLETSLPPPALLGHLQQIESAHGRIRGRERWAPRTLDLDLLLYGDDQFNDTDLVVPHPEIPNRNFVLCPLLEINPHIKVPGAGPADLLLEQTGRAGLEKLGE